MSIRLPFRYLQPYFFAGLFDDPLLFVRIRPTGKSILFDCGQMQHVAKRVLKSLSAVFVSHLHMDHFMGLDTLIRNVHVSPRVVEIFGPAGIAARTCHKLAAYEWNLVEPSWCSFRAHEVLDGRTASFVFPGPEGFVCLSEGKTERNDPLIFQNEYLEVEAYPGDHKVPSLFFRIRENVPFLIDEKKMDRAGLVKGEWLRLLKKRLWGNDEATEPLAVLRRHGEEVLEERVFDPERLYDTIRLEQAPSTIGYVSDIGFSEDSLQRMTSVLKGAALVVCECSFLAADLDKARVSNHLCTTDVNHLVDRLRPAFVLPMHLSKSYVGKSHLLYQELEFPPGVTLLELPDRVAPRPLLMEEAVGLLKPRHMRP